MAVNTEELAQELRKKRDKSSFAAADLLSSGSTLLNLACTGRILGAFLKGKYYLFVGDSNSGKTWLVLNAFAEAANKASFDDYRLIYDNPEDGALMDITRYFGKKTSQRLEPPAGDRAEPVYSETVEEFWFHVDDAIKSGKPFIYVLDSMDALSSKSQKEHFKKRKNAYRKGTKTPGSYGDGKAKENSQDVRLVLKPLKETGSILIIICQTRDAIDSLFEDKTRSGGRGLKFYATVEIWASVKKALTKHIRDKDRKVGTLSKVQCKRSRVTGKDRTVDVPIYNSFGVDDVGSCIDYLIEEQHWKKKGDGSINAKDFEVALKRNELIKHVEENNLESNLRSLVGKVWREIEEACEINRKARYE